MGSRRGVWAKRRVRHRMDDQLANLDPLEFERVMADYYRQQGYSVEECGTGGTGRGFDGGIDLKLRRDGEYIVVQCKRHNAYQLTHNPLHELLGVAGTEGADRCILVNTGEFTAYAWEVAAKNPKLELIDGGTLRRMLPELAQPAEQVAVLPMPNAEPQWVRVSEQGSRRKRESDGISGGWVAAAALIFALVILRQCSASSPKKAVPAALPAEVSAAQPQVQHQQAPASAEKVQPVPRSQPRSYTKEELLEKQRLADEAMKIIEATTPEM